MAVKSIFSISGGFGILILLCSCVIDKPGPEDCEIVDSRIIRITEGSSYDIAVHSENGDHFYINRGLQQGLNLIDLNNAILNKSVTLHLARIMGGLAVSEHISQIEAKGDIIFTEFD
ncbi:MAG: hypothetical protein HKO90_06925 [Flavobacteriaceae bacterium]|nr:hypothetical protein [Flavobacteriaceae bacterium]